MQCSAKKHSNARPAAKEKAEASQGNVKQVTSEKHQSNSKAKRLDAKQRKFERGNARRPASPKNSGVQLCFEAVGVFVWVVSIWCVSVCVCVCVWFLRVVVGVRVMEIK